MRAAATARLVTPSATPLRKSRVSAPPVVLTTEALLGGKARSRKQLLVPLDWVSAIRQGIPAAAVDALAANVRLSQAELAATLGIPERTLVRRKKEGVLNSEESAKLVRMARVVERAEGVFGDFDGALDWLKSSNASLAAVTPLSLLDTEFGAESVMDALGRIEHGVFA